MLLITFGFETAGAQSIAVMEVTAEKATIYARPDLNSEPLGFIRQGRSVRPQGREGEFFKVKLKSGAAGWVQRADLSPGEAEIEEAEAGRESAPRAASDDFSRWNLQIGISSGSSGGRTYTEVNLGVGYYFKRWLEWHNSLFASLDRVRNVYGLDTSLRGVLNTDIGGIAHLHGFAGPGYRFASDSAYNTLFAEAGLITSVAGFSVGGGLRTFFYKFKDAAAQDETQYFIILSGSARL